MDKAWYDLKNYGDQGGCNWPRQTTPSEILRNSSDHTKAKSNNWFIINQNIIYIIRWQMFFGWNVIVRSIPALLKINVLNVGMVCKAAAGLKGAQSPKPPTIWSRVTKMQNREPTRAPQTYDSYSNSLPPMEE